MSASMQMIQVSFPGNPKKYNYIAPRIVGVGDSVVVDSPYSGWVALSVLSVRDITLDETLSGMHQFKSIVGVVNDVDAETFETLATSEAKRVTEALKSVKQFAHDALITKTLCGTTPEFESAVWVLTVAGFTVGDIFRDIP